MVLNLAIEADQFMRFLGRLHPAATHFPIALLILAAMAEVGNIFRRDHRHSNFALTCLVIGTLGAAVAAWFGWINADHEPHGKGLTNLIFWHRWVGIGVVVFAAISLAARIADRMRPSDTAIHTYRGTILGAALLVSVSGYLGGEIVFGSNHLLAVFNTPESVEPAPETVVPEDVPESVELPVASRLFIETVYPVMTEYCFHCHGADKQKGALRLDLQADVETVVYAGEPIDSPLYERIALPEGHPDLMPPDERLPEDVVQAFHEWIRQGAPWVDAGSLSSASAAPVEAPAATTPPEPVLNLDPVDDEAPADEDAITEVESVLAGLRARGIRAVRLAQNETDVAVNLALRQQDATDDTLELLRDLGPHLTRLDLGGTAVTDDGLAILESFPRLERLYLEKTAITDGAFEHIAHLESLEYLNCYSTAITDEAASWIAGLPSLRQFFVWDTDMTLDAVEQLRRDLPDLEVIDQAQ